MTVWAMNFLHLGKFGNKVYLQFADLLDTKIKSEANVAKIGCKTGLTINGQSKFILPERGLKGAIMFDGPVGQKNYSPQDVEAVIRHLIGKAEKQKKSGGK